MLVPKPDTRTDAQKAADHLEQELCGLGLKPTEHAQKGWYRKFEEAAQTHHKLHQEVTGYGRELGTEYAHNWTLLGIARSLNHEYKASQHAVGVHCPVVIEHLEEYAEKYDPEKEHKGKHPKKRKEESWTTSVPGKRSGPSGARGGDF